jgi:hypothetical protein
MAKFVELRPGEVVRIGATLVTLEQKSGQRARLRIDGTEPVTHLKAVAPDPGLEAVMTRPPKLFERP